ncbi:flagellar biosynthesis protein FlgJ [Buchnera aphidicola (Aphis craccivora)]|uniref:Rod-binding protein n=1 Tax=Buchnera aphidicola (Aphis craccivora) TaxID=466616 RepID=A0A4D6XN81_9GAMM|nr:rod-binding protein [Buchnera aphidicola]QCI16587.1 flagellar biosynthesis protein FlgJ [Buchnera aphidicola (Aphis craccivora)]QLL40721.1 flagellar biosynthesis protein FlgJ [Buchnera aphidicola (Aphis craccivore)]WAI17560.1 MAG: rod-binding protein [Buchnera aphidicola (Aphis craccivora)]
MQNYLSLFNITNYHAKLVNDLKYQVKVNPKKYSSETAKQVEGVFIYMLLKSMRNSLIKDSLLDNNQSRLYTEVYDEQISKELTKKGIGLADMILKQIEQKKIYI